MLGRTVSIEEALGPQAPASLDSGDRRAGGGQERLRWLLRASSIRRPKATSPTSTAQPLAAQVQSPRTQVTRKPAPQTTCSQRRGTHDRRTFTCRIALVSMARTAVPAGGSAPAKSGLRLHGGPARPNRSSRSTTGASRWPLPLAHLEPPRSRARDLCVGLPADPPRPTSESDGRRRAPARRRGQARSPGHRRGSRGAFGAAIPRGRGLPFVALSDPRRPTAGTARKHWRSAQTQRCRRRCRRRDSNPRHADYDSAALTD